MKENKPELSNPGLTIEKLLKAKAILDANDVPGYFVPTPVHPCAVGYTVTENGSVSTVVLLSPIMYNGKLHPFETLVRDNHMETLAEYHYQTLAEARSGHKASCRLHFESQ